MSTVEFVGYAGKTVPCRLWRPTKDGKFPGIVFVTEAFGLTAEMERLGKMIASWGYVVLAPDFFTDGWFKCLRMLMKDLHSGGGGSAETLLRARAFLAEQPFVNSTALGILGFCIGGGFALLLAKNELFRVAAAFYGQTPNSLDGACPVTASYGARDKALAPSAAKLRNELNRLGVENDVKVYPDAGHGFMNEAPNPVLGLLAKIAPVHAGYNEAAAADATERLHRFLAEHLGPSDAGEPIVRGV